MTTSKQSVLTEQDVALLKQTAASANTLVEHVTALASKAENPLLHVLALQMQQQALAIKGQADQLQSLTTQDEQ